MATIHLSSEDGNDAHDGSTMVEILFERDNWRA
jgi:hypothetical protein